MRVSERAAICVLVAVGAAPVVGGQTITTLAGGGPVALPALSAALNQPERLARDAAGNFYISDCGSNRVYKMSVDGTLGVVAGAGVLIGGYGGDGGPATAALLNCPQGVAVDASGNVFIADSDNNVIREVKAADGTILTIAGSGAQGFSGDGGPATQAQLFLPMGLATDSAGNVYIADSGSSTIREWNAATLTISTVAGRGMLPGFSGDGGLATAAQLDTPEDVLVDGSGNLWIADFLNNRIREVEASTGSISTVAGGEFGGSGGDGGPALDAELSLPLSLGLDGAGNLYINDSGNNLIREVVASSGDIQTVAGNRLGNGSTADDIPALQASMQFTEGLYIDADGDIWLADQIDGLVREITPGNGEIATVAGDRKGYSLDGFSAAAAQLGSMWGLATDASGDLFYSTLPRSDLSPLVVDLPSTEGASVVHEVNASTGAVTTIAGNGTQGYSGDAGPATSAELAVPSGVATDAAGNLYIADYGASVVREVSAGDGHISTVAGTGVAGFSGDGGAATAAELNSPRGVYVDAHGNLWIADTGNNAIREVTNGNIGTAAGTGTAGYGGDGGSPTLATLNQPRDVFADAAGNVFIADSGNHVIREIAASTGAMATVAGTGASGYSGDDGPATQATLSTPSGVRADVAGNIYIADSGNFVVREVAAASGYIATIAGTGTAGSSGDNGPAAQAELGVPISLAIGAGTLLVADAAAARIRQIASALPPPGTTALTLNSSNHEVAAFQTLTLTADLNWSGSPVPTGTVTFTDGAATLGSASVNAQGEAALAVALAAGTHGLQASYGGDANYSASRSGTFTQSVGLASTSLLLQSSATVVAPNQDVTLTATLTYGGAGTPGGTVAFLDGNNTLGNAPLSGGAATLTLNTLSLGEHSIGAAYSGDANFDASNSGNVAEFVGEIATTTSLLSSSASAAAGTSITLTATVKPGAAGNPTGTVSFSDGATSLGTVALTDGAAALTTASLPTGTQTLVATYNGDNSFAPSSSTPLQQAITPDSTVTTLSAAPNPALVGQPVTLTATVQSSPPATVTGQIAFSDGAAALGSIALSNGQATLTVNRLAIGVHSLVAAYLGTTTFASSAFAPLTENIAGNATSTTLTASLNPSASGQSVTLTAVVQSGGAPGTPTGSVAFNVGGTTLGTATLASGVATLATTALPTGTQTLTAVYSGDASFASSTSGGLADEVTPSDFSIAATASGTSTIAPGASAAFLVTVAAQPAGADFTGLVTLSVTGLPPGAIATFAPASLAPGASGGSSLLTVQTSAAGSLAPSGRDFGGGQFALALWLLALGLLFGSVRRSRARRANFRWTAALLAAIVLAAAGCGGGPPAANAASDADAAGASYTLIITGASAGTVHTVSATLSLQ